MMTRFPPLANGKIFSFLILFLLAPAAFAALPPVLNFSDITSGPKTGNTDGLGSGAIVTVWGNNLGDVQGTSKIYVGNQEASHVYYWGKADGSKLAGPADLSTFHKMQTISFSVPASATDGLNDIHVEVGSPAVPSNSLPFTVRSGSIFFVHTNGSDTGNGSWSAPWKTLDYVSLGAGSKFKAGDIVYALDGVVDTGGLPIRSLTGSIDNPFTIAAYPGALVLIESSGTYGIGNFSNASSYFNFSKLTVKSNGTGISSFKGMRAIANEITNYPGGCSNGQSGAISGSNLFGTDTVGGAKAYGNYIHDFGCDTTSKLHHVFYISNRSGVSAEAFELGWNFLTDNKVHHGLHVYDEGVCGDFTGTIRIHDNVVRNQVGAAVDVASAGYSDPCFTMPVEIYNNLFINVGLETTSCTGQHNQAISLMKQTTRIHAKVYNNTLVGYGENGTGFALQVQANGSVDWNFGGTWEFINNIIVDTNDLPYERPTYWKAPDVSGNNLWYNGGDTTPSSPPSWDTNFKTAAPSYVNTVANDYSITDTSPAYKAGADTSSIVQYDLVGYPRTAGTPSIGAFEYHADILASPKQPPFQGTPGSSTN